MSCYCLDPSKTVTVNQLCCGFFAAVRTTIQSDLLRVPQLYLWGSPLFFFFFCFSFPSYISGVHHSSSFFFSFPSYASGVHHSSSSSSLSSSSLSSSSSAFPAISLEFTLLLLLLLRSQLYLWGSPFFFFFLCVSQLYLWGSPFLFFFCLPRLDLLGSPFFCCFPQLYLWGSPFWVRFSA